jgi:superfamily II DNA or RNA helicase
MSKLVLDSPTQVRIPDDAHPEQFVKEYLTYTDKSVEYQIRRLKKAAWFDAEKHAEKLEELQALKRPCLLYKDDLGYYTLSGLTQDVAQVLRLEVENNLIYPPAKTIPWAKVPPELRQYQQDTVALFLDSRHAAAEMATGLGKSFIILHIAKRLGLKTVVMAPTTSIADQLYDDFVAYLGKKYVGRFYGGKKDSEKLITVAIHASLARIERGSGDWSAFADTNVFIADESHLCPAATLYQVCTGLLANAPYRFFLSGTQLRGDGSGLLLKGITGPILKRMTVVDGVEQGYLAKPQFRIIQTTSSDPYESSDPMKMTQKHLLYNPTVLAKAAGIANLAVSKLGHQVLILIDEVKQFRFLTPYLRHETKFAHGPLNSDNEGDVPEEHHTTDNGKLVKEFNDGKFPILVGTSAIGLGTNIKPARTLIYLMGGKSEVQVRQAVGRGTRLVPGKTDCTIIDFDVANIELVHRHALERLEIYESIYPDVEIC